MDRWTQELTETYRHMVLARLVEDGDLPSHVLGPGQVDLSRTPEQRENIGGQWHLPPGTTPE